MITKPIQNTSLLKRFLLNRLSFWKQRKQLLTLLCICGLTISSLAWYHGFVPIASGNERAGIRHSLNLRFLPSSVRVNSGGSEAWTDCITEVDFSISPKQFDTLLSGREFTKVSPSSVKAKVTRAHRIEGYKGFKVDAIWEWKYRDPNSSNHKIEAQCTLYTNKARDRVFVVFITD